MTAQPEPAESGGRRYVVLDRDGTVIEEKDHLSDPLEVELLPGAAEGLRQLLDMGLGLVMITNQSGVGRGMFDLRQLGRVHAQLSELLETQAVHIDRIYFCPHTPQDGCECRKPNTALLDQAARELRFDPKTCFVIGDNSTDIELGRQAGATTFLVRTGHGTRVSQEGLANPNHTVDGVKHAAQVIQGILNDAMQKVSG